MSQPVRTGSVHPVTWLLTLLAVGLVVLPIWGLWLTYHSPSSPWSPPPQDLSVLGPLMGRSLALAFWVSLLALVAGTWLAWVDSRTDFVGRKWASLLAILPLATPSYLIARILREEMAPEGRLGSVLGTSEAFTGFWPAVLVLSITCTPYVHVLVRAALERASASEEEAARSLGASTGRILKSVVAPRIRPTWAFSLVLVGLYVVSDFGAVATLDCEVLTWELYRATNKQDMVMLGTALMGVVIPLLLVTRWLHGSHSPDRQRSAAYHQRRPLRGLPLLGTWLLLGLVIGIGVLLPVVVLVDWISMGLANPDIQFASILAPTTATLRATAIGALVVVLLAAAPSWISARRGGKTGAIVEASVYLTSSLPGILIGVGLLHLLQLKAQLPGDIAIWEGLQSAGVFLMLAYGMRFLSQAYAALKPAVLTLEQSQEEAATLLGASPWRRLHTLVLPAMAPGTAAAYMLVFLSIAKELPITMLLLSDQRTLSFRIFDSSEEAVLYNVGLAGLVLLVLAIALQVLLIRWRNQSVPARH